MLRLLGIVVGVCVFCRWATGRWPWDFLRPPSTRSQAVFRARKLLAVRANASREEIIDAHRKLIAAVHPDRGGTNGQVHEANAARDLLLDELPDGN
jgi:hypothetical protein